MYRFMMPLRAAVLLACASCAASSLPGSPSTERAFQDELDFAVQLARHRYFDLAGETIGNLEKDRLNPDQELSVNLTRFTVTIPSEGKFLISAIVLHPTNSLICLRLTGFSARR